MGKAIINSHLGSGLYDVDLCFDNATIEAKKTAIEKKITEIETSLLELVAKKTDAQNKVNVAINNINNYLATTPPDFLASHPDEINALQKEGLEARAEYDSIARQENRLKTLKLSLQKESLFLDKYCPSTIKTTAWCVEHRTNLTGTTRSIEVDYAVIRDTSTNQIRTEGVWLPGQTSAPTDILRHPMAGSEHSTWFDIAMAPAAQKHKGRYRVATINALNTFNNTADITLEGRYSIDEYSKNLLGTEAIHPMIAGGQQQNVSNCPVVYMTCNAEAFEVGDKVIVDLHNGGGLPTVIGFYSNPRKCLSFAWSEWVGIGDATANAVSLINCFFTVNDPSEHLADGSISIDGSITNNIINFTIGSDSGSGSKVLTKTVYINNNLVRLDYTQTISLSWSGLLSETYGPYTCNGAGNAQLTVTVDLSINGISQGTVFNFTQTGSSTKTTNYDTSYVGSFNEDESISFNVQSKTFCIFEDGAIKAERVCIASGTRNWKNHNLLSSVFNWQVSSNGDLSKLEIYDSTGQQATWPGVLSNAMHMTSGAGIPYAMPLPIYKTQYVRMDGVFILNWD